MVNQLDTSALDPGGFKSLKDEQLANTLASQKIQAGNVANAQAASTYGAQALTAAAASGDPNIWKAAKTHMADLGMDTSSLSDDVTQGKAQIDALRQAQYNSNPLMAALGLGIKEQQAAATSAGVNGTTAPTGPVNPLTGGAMTLPGAPAPVKLAVEPPAGPDTGSALPQVNAEPRNPGMALPANQGAPAPVAAAPAAPVASPDVISAARMRAINQIGPLTPNANPRTKSDWESQINDLVNKDPAVMQAQAVASASGSAEGKDKGTAPAEAINSDEITNRLMKNLDALEKLNSSTPDSAIVGPETKALFSKRVGSGADANALAQWQQIDQQQIMGDLGQLVKAGVIRPSKYVLQVLNTNSGIPADMPMAGRADLISNLKKEIVNRNTTAQNVNARLNGGSVQPYSPVLSPDNSVISPSANSYKKGMIQQGNDGSYVLIGDDPTQQSSWKKVK